MIDLRPIHIDEDGVPIDYLNNLDGEEALESEMEFYFEQELTKMEKKGILQNG